MKKIIKITEPEEIIKIVSWEIRLKKEALGRERGVLVGIGGNGCEYRFEYEGISGNYEPLTIIETRGKKNLRERVKNFFSQ